MNLLDILDDWVLGPLNIFNKAQRYIMGACYRDIGYQLAMPRCDKGGNFPVLEAQKLLKNYGIVTYGRTHDATYFYFYVKKRQARWAEYLLLHAGVELHSPLFDQRNPGYMASHEPGWMPTPWSEKGERQRAEEGTEHSTEHEEEPQRNGSSSVDSMVDRALRWLD